MYHSFPEINLDAATALWANRIQAEFEESPGLRLTIAQASRFWGLDEVACQALFAALVHGGFLTRTRHGFFVRADAH